MFLFKFFFICQKSAKWLANIHILLKLHRYKQIIIFDLTDSVIVASFFSFSCVARIDFWIVTFG